MMLASQSIIATQSFEIGKYAICYIASWCDKKMAQQKVRIFHFLAI